MNQTFEQSSPNSWGLVLCGGGAKGAYQIGAWKALEEYGVMKQIGGISGDSIGAINTLLMAALTQEEAANIWSEIDFLTVFDTEPELFDMIEGTFSRNEMLELMREHIDYQKVANSPYLLKVNITELGPAGDETNKKPVYETLNHKSQKEIEDLILASSALPVVYEAVQIGGKYYRDGGMTDNMPIKPLYDAGYRKIMVIALKQNAAINSDLYPDCEILLMKPSIGLGDLATGTLNFKQRDIKLRMELGYRDTLRNLKAFFEQDAEYLSQLDALAKIDHQELSVQYKHDELNERVQGHMNQFQSILDKYGID